MYSQNYIEISLFIFAYKRNVFVIRHLSTIRNQQLMR